MDILSILEFFLNMQKQKKADAMQGFNITEMLAGKEGGSYAQAALDAPNAMKGWGAITGGIKQAPVMKAAPGMEEAMDFATPVQAMTQQLSRGPMNFFTGGAKATEVPMTQPSYPQYRQTPEQAAAIERIKLSQQEGQRAIAGDIAGVAKTWVKPGATEGTTQNLSPEEQEEAAKTGKINPSWMPRAPQAATGGIEWTHDLDRRKVVSSLAAVNNDPSKLTPELQALGVNYNLVKKVGTTWQLGNWQEAEKTIPTFATPKEAMIEGGKYAPPEHNTTPRATTGGYTWHYEAKPGAGQPLGQDHINGLENAAVYEILPKVKAAIQASDKTMGLDKVNAIIASMKDQQTGRYQLSSIARWLGDEDRASINKRMIGSAQIMKEKNKSSWEAWDESGKALTPPAKKEEALEASHTAFKPPGTKRSRDDRIKELSVETDPKTGKFKYNSNEIKAILKKEDY
jgi:hypothetical protein